MSLFTPDVVIEGGNTNAVKIDGSGVTQPVSGTVAVNNFPATQPVSGSVSVSGAVVVTGPLTDTQLRATPVPISGTVSTSAPVALSSTITQITSTATNQTLLAANASRKGAILFFTSGNWYVKFGAGASATSRTYYVSSANTIIETSIWAGQIDVACTTTGKLVDVTELV